MSDGLRGGGDSSFIKGSNKMIIIYDNVLMTLYYYHTPLSCVELFFFVKISVVLQMDKTVKKICILNDFPCEMDFYHPKSPNPTSLRVALRHIIFSHTLHLGHVNNSKYTAQS